MGNRVAVTTSQGPFIGSEALSNGVLRRHQLRSQYRAIYPDVYVGRHQQLTLLQRSRAAWLWSHRRGIIAGLTAAAWHGSKWVDDDLPVELVWSNARPPCGVRTYDNRLAAEDFGMVGDIPLTTPARTAFDIGRRGALDVAVAQLDSLMRATNVEASEIARLADRHRGARGCRQLETALELVDPGAQSPKETWLRLLLIRAGFPRPRTQIPVVSPAGHLYYLDMGWEDVMVAVEYDGEQHRLDRWQYTKDIRRQEALERLGWIVVRVVADDHPIEIIRRVKDVVDERRASLR